MMMIKFLWKIKADPCKEFLVMTPYKCVLDVIKLWVKDNPDFKYLKTPFKIEFVDEVRVDVT